MALLNYNFNPKDIEDFNFVALYEKRRRDSCFAFVFENNGKIYALRDHFGIVPLYFSWRDDGIVFSTTLDPLVTSKSQLDLQGYKAYIALGTPKVIPLFEDVGIVPPGTVVEIDKKSKEVKPIYTYRFKALSINKFCRLGELVELLDHLLLQAVERTVKYDKVGLYLSGGIDSTITGVYLTKCGIEVNAYTCARWGEKGSEMRYSRMGAESIGVREHHIDVLDSGKAKEGLDKIIDIYKAPYGVSSSIGVVSLWLHTAISKEKQIYDGQGTDTLSCAVCEQNMFYLFSFVPAFIRGRIKYKLSTDVVDVYIRMHSKRLLNSEDIPLTILNTIQTAVGKIQRLSVAGMLICETPGDSEGLRVPATNLNILSSSPFFDVDVAEFFLGIPLRHKINFGSKSYMVLDKIVLRELAKRYLNPEVIKMKKGFQIPLHIYGIDKELEKFEAPIDIPTDRESKFAAYTMSKYCESRNLDILHIQR